LEFFDITKRLVWPNIKTKKNKIKRIDRRVCFAKHTLDPKQIGPVRPKARPSSVSTVSGFFMAGSSSVVRAGLDFSWARPRLGWPGHWHKLVSRWAAGTHA